MDRIGRVVSWDGSTATIEVGLQDECVSGSCSDCHAAAAEGMWVLEVPWRRPATVGERVLVKERRPFFRLLCWTMFLVGFCVVIGLGQALLESTRADGSGAQRGLVVSALAVGVGAWLGTRQWSRRRSQFRVQALEQNPLDGGFTPRRRGGARRQPFVSIDSVRRMDR